MSPFSPTLVQGAEAPLMIAEQLTRADRYRLGDVVILARGGGSLEDLMAFNEEVVVRSIAACTIPIVCGAGHEVDVSLADLAADVRAATPSAAAELVSDRSEDLLLRVRGFHRGMMDALSGRISETHRRLERCSTDVMAALARGRMEPAMRRNDEALREIHGGAKERLENFRRRLELAMRSTIDASPQSVLSRGYARITRGGVGIDSAGMLSEGDDIEIRFAEDKASAEVKTN